MQNFSPFLPVPATLGIPLPVLSLPTSRTRPAPYSAGLPLPVPLHYLILYESVIYDAQKSSLVVRWP